MHDNQGQRIGIKSELFPNFESFKDRYGLFLSKGKYGSKKKLTVKDLVNSEVVKVWATAYINKENDLNDSNYGFEENGYAVSFDSDQGNYDLTSPYNPAGGVDPINGNFGHETPPVKAFPVTERDIENFPNTVDAQPRNWPTNLINSYWI